MINNFEFYQPIKIYFGQGKIKELNEILYEYGYKNGVLVCDPYFRGLAEGLLKNCEMIKAIYSNIEPNPQLVGVKDIIKLIKEKGADIVIALGGGSSIDSAKLAGALAYADDKIEDYYWDKKTFPKDKIDLIAIPTTAGTGSEVTQVAVINNGVNKKTIHHKSLMPITAIVDPELTYTLPQLATIETGLDALSHALEGFWSIHSQPLTDLVAMESVRVIVENLERVYDNPSDTEARNHMSYAALLAGLAFAQSKTAGVHACSYPLSMDYHLTHGSACAFTLDSFIRINRSKKLEYLASSIGTNCDHLANWVKHLKKKSNLKRTLSDCGINNVAPLAEKCLNHPLIKNNPVKLTKEQLIKMFEEKR